MSLRIFADDAEGLISAIEKSVAHCAVEKRGASSSIRFVTQLKELLGFVSREAIELCVSDLIFEGQPEIDSVEVLIRLREKNPKAGILVYTGYTVTKNQETKLRDIRAKIVKKLDPNISPSNIVDLLVTNDWSAFDEIESEEAEKGDSLESLLDAAELRIRLNQIDRDIEALKESNASMKEVHELLVADILEELDQMPNKKSKTLYVGSTAVSIDELKTDVQRLTERGRKLIRLHHDLNKRLRREAR